jgi:hypothetical protein
VTGLPEPAARRPAGPTTSRRVDVTPSAHPRCLYATDPIARPHCQLTAVVRYGRAALCADCDRRRSTVGKGQAPRRLPEPGPPIDPLGWIVEADRDLRTATRELYAAVSRARQRGHPWSAIAHALGISRQAAQQRFSHAHSPDRERGLP